MIRVLLIDDHPVVRLGYHRLLDQTGDIQVIAEADCVEVAYQAFIETSPDICITDLSLPGAGGLELMRKILIRDAQAKLLIFSMYDSTHLVRRALDDGAYGFVSKNAPPESLVAAVRAVYQGQRYLSDDISSALLKHHADAEAERLASLSPREFEIFRLLAESRSSSECAQILKLSPKTIANHQTNIKEKLDVSTSAALVHLALRNGIIQQREP